MAKRSPTGLVPAAARVAAPVHVHRDLAQGSIDAFVEAIGGRTRLIEMLSVGASDPAVEEVLGILTDPLTQSRSLADICRQARFSVADFFLAFSKASLVRGELTSRVKVEKQLGAIIDDLLLQAQPHEETCLACQGTGFKPPAEPTPAQPNPNPIPCKECYTRGKRTVGGDLERQKLVLDMARLLPKNGGPSVTLNNQTNVLNASGRSSGGLEQLQQMVSEALYQGAPAILPGDLVDPEPERG